MSWLIIILIVLYLIFEDHVFRSEHDKKIVRLIFIAMLIMAIIDLLTGLQS